MRTLLIDNRCDGCWYRIGNTMPWQYGGKSTIEAVDQAYARCFISEGELVMDIVDGHTFEYTKGEVKPLKRHSPSQDSQPYPKGRWT